MTPPAAMAMATCALCPEMIDWAHPTKLPELRVDPKSAQHLEPRTGGGGRETNLKNVIEARRGVGGSLGLAALAMPRAAAAAAKNQREHDKQESGRVCVAAGLQIAILRRAIGLLALP